MQLFQNEMNLLFLIQAKFLTEISRTTPTRVAEPKIAVAYLLNKLPSPMTAQKNR